MRDTPRASGRIRGPRCWLIAGICVVAGCGGPEEPATESGPEPAPDPEPAPAPGPVAGEVTVTGVVTFDLVPSVPGGLGGSGLDYAHTAAAPARGVPVEFVAGDAVLGSATTDAEGAYALSVPAGTTGYLRVKAEMQRAASPRWDFRVVDNTQGDALYVLEGGTFDSGASDSVHDLHAASGWTGAAYTEPRSAAPFAILDAVYDGADLLRASAPGVDLPALVLHWSPDNIPSYAPSGGPDTVTGEIGTSYYGTGPDGGIFLLGAEDADTDEYDRHVILHEWGHYVEDALGRTDSIGGPHSLSDSLDMRVAFGEGWGNAFSALATGDSLYRDALGPAQSSAPAFDVEGSRFFEPQNPAPGWFSEQSIHELIYDLADADADGADSLALDFGVVLAALTEAQRDSVALTSVFPFIDALMAAEPAAAAEIDALVAEQSIATVTDGYGSTATNDAGSDDVLPIYTPLTVNGPSAARVCSTDEFRSGITGMTNKLGSRRFLRFSLGAPGSVTLTATATEVPVDAMADPDLVLHQAGAMLVSEGPPSAACADTASPDWQPQSCVESATTSLAAGDYVLEVYEYTNTLADDAETPPIGRTCFDVTVTQP